MDPTRIGLFTLAEQRLAWAEQRQALLAENIANASTPAYQPKDLQPFAQTLSRFAMEEPERTQPNHLRGTEGGALQPVQESRPAAKSPDGNSVALDRQLSKVADTETTQALVTSIYKAYVGMFGMALGKA